MTPKPRTGAAYPVATLAALTSLQAQKAAQKVAQTTAAELLKPYDDTRERVSKLALSFDGMDAFTTRYLVDNGQRFQREPASPGLAVGHGFVLETAESTLRVYDQESGLPLMPPISLNNQRTDEPACPLNSTAQMTSSLLAPL